MSDFSILMLTYHRPDLLEKTLESYCDTHCDYPHDLYIQNNCGTAEVRNVIEKWKPKLSFLKDVKFNEKNYGLSYCTNRFWREAQTEYIGKIDSDMLFETKDWIRTLHESMLKVREVDDRWLLLHGRYTQDGWDYYRGDTKPEFDINGVTMLEAVHGPNKARHGDGCMYIGHRGSLRQIGPIPVFNSNIFGWDHYQKMTAARGWKLAYIKDLKCFHLGAGPGYLTKNTEYAEEIALERRK